MGQRAVIYCRVSTNDQSCERQQVELQAFAKRAGFEICGVFAEVASGVKNHNTERKKVMALAQARHIDAILVTELTRWGRSTTDLMRTLQDLHSWNVSLIAQSGLQFDLNSAQGKLMATVMASIAEFERDLLKERVRSGLALAKARGKKLGRQVGFKPKSDKFGPKILEMVAQGKSYRAIAKELGLSKNTVLAVVQKERII